MSSWNLLLRALWQPIWCLGVYVHTLYYQIWKKHYNKLFCSAYMDTLGRWAGCFVAFPNGLGHFKLALGPHIALWPYIPGFHGSWYQKVLQSSPSYPCEIKLSTSYNCSHTCRHHQECREPDGIHWNATAHRNMTLMLLTHCADSWGISLIPSKKYRCPLQGVIGSKVENRMSSKWVSC